MNNLKPNKKDLEDWEALCKGLSNAPRKASYDGYYTNRNAGKYDLIHIPNWYLLSQDPLMPEMRKWMRDNGFELVFFGNGWGWRLRKDWKEKIDMLKELVS